MLSYNTLLKDKETKLLSLTSLNQEEFEALLPAFEEAWQKDLEERIQQEERKRRPGGGRKPTLKTLEDKLLFALVYVKIYPLQEVMGTLFGMSQGQANVWIHRLTPVLHSALKEEQLLPERDPLTLEETLAEYALLEFVIDGTERRRQRPKDAVKQKEYYSGKKSPYGQKQRDCSSSEFQSVLSQPDIQRSAT